MKNKNQKENWEQLVMRIEKITLDCYLNSISQEEARDEILELFKSEKKKLLEKIEEIIDDNNDLLIRWQKEELKDEIKKELKVDKKPN